MLRRRLLLAGLATASSQALATASFGYAVPASPRMTERPEGAAHQTFAGTGFMLPSSSRYFNTVAELKSSMVAPEVTNVSTLGFYEAGDGGGAIYVRVALPTVVKPWQMQSADGTQWELSTHEASLLQFGVRRGKYGANNAVAMENTARLEEAVEWVLTRGDSRQRLLRSPEGTIEFMDFSLPTDAAYLTFIGTSWNNSVWLFKTHTPGVGCSVGSVENSFWFLQFLQYIPEGDGQQTIVPDRTLLRFQRPPRPDLPAAQRSGPDLDGTVMFCKFSRASVAIEAIGRGLRAESNLFSLCDRCIKLGWGGPRDYKYGGSAQSFQAGYRAFQFQNNRYHSYRYAAVTNDGPYADMLQGILITGSYCDIGRPIFDGVLIDGKVEALVTQTTTEALRLRHGSKRYQISGNFSGSLEAQRTPEYLIRLFGDQFAGKFSDLTLSNSEKHAIFHDGTVDGTNSARRGACTGLDVDGVMFANVCTSGDEFSPIALLGEHHEGVVRNVVLVRTKPLVGFVRTSAGSASIFVSNLALLGGSGRTPHHVGPGGRYGVEYVEELRLGSDGGGRIMRGVGSPVDTVSASPGSLYIRVDGAADTTLFVKVFGRDEDGWYCAPLLAPLATNK